MHKTGQDSSTTYDQSQTDSASSDQQETGNSVTGDTAEPEYRGDDRNHQKNDGPTNHVVLLRKTGIDRLTTQLTCRGGR